MSARCEPLPAVNERLTVDQMSRVGDKLNLEYVREGKSYTTTAVIGDKESASADGSGLIHPAFAGAALTNASNGTGVLIQTVSDASPAAQNGFRPNDVILAVGRMRVTNIEQLRVAVRGANSFAVTIRRGNATLVFPVG